MLFNEVEKVSRCTSLALSTCCGVNNSIIVFLHKNLNDSDVARNYGHFRFYLLIGSSSNVTRIRDAEWSARQSVGGLSMCPGHRDGISVVNVIITKEPFSTFGKI